MNPQSDHGRQRGSSGGRGTPCPAGGGAGAPPLARQGMPRAPPRGPAPTALLPREVDALYDALEATAAALDACGARWFAVAGTLLGAVRQRSILFCDDDVDIAVLEADYDRVKEALPDLLARAGGGDCSAGDRRAAYAYVRRPWPACDRVRPGYGQSCSHVWVDVFVLRRYESADALRKLLCGGGDGHDGDGGEEGSGVEAEDPLPEPLRHARYPLYHYDTAQAVRLWPREWLAPEAVEVDAPLQRLALAEAVERPSDDADEELAPRAPRVERLAHLRVPGPGDAVGYLRRAFGEACFDEYPVGAAAHAAWQAEFAGRGVDAKDGVGGAPRMLPLRPEHYRPMQHSRRAKRANDVASFDEASLRARLRRYDEAAATLVDRH